MVVVDDGATADFTVVFGADADGRVTRSMSSGTDGYAAEVAATGAGSTRKHSKRFE